MFFVLLVLCGIIGGYWYLTDSNRVRSMAQAYLSEFLGGEVEIRRARLSIFEGLRLDGVTVRVAEPQRDDSVVFTAQTLLVKYNHRALLNGRHEATQIIALEPHVRLCEDLSRSKDAWNFQRLRRSTTPAEASSTGRPPVLPQILLRSGLVDYACIENGRYRELGTMAVEGQLAPADLANRYRFELKSRGLGESAGPGVSGAVDLGSGALDARVVSFDFGGSIKTVLPTQVQQWLNRHDLTGRIDQLSVGYRPRPGNAPDDFVVDARLADVSMAFQREDLLSPRQRQQQHTVRSFTTRLKAAGYNPLGAMDLVRENYEGRPLGLLGVSGSIIFTRDAGKDRIDIDLHGSAENNRFGVAGQIEGFEPDAPFNISVRADQLSIPRNPRYIASLPNEVKQLYYRFRPVGVAQLALNLKRQQPGGRVVPTGDVRLINASFVYEFFPYPLERVSGTLTLDQDPQTGKDRVRLIDVVGHGPKGSANADATLTVNATVTPPDETNRVDLTVIGRGVTLDDQLYAALDPSVRTTLAGFAVPGRLYPCLSGDFVARLHRPEGLDKPETVHVDLLIAQASGSYALFPYPLNDLTGKLHIGPDSVEVGHVTMRDGDRELVISGRVQTPADGPAIPDLVVRGRNIPIDGALLDALPSAQREQVARIGLHGKFDIDGRLLPPKAGPGASAGSRPTTLPSDLDFDIKLALRDASAWPIDGTLAVSDLKADMHLTSAGLSVPAFEARRGDATVRGRVEADWSASAPSLVLEAAADNLLLDAELYRLLPAEAQRTWAQFQPRGTLDVRLAYRSPSTRPTTTPSTRPAEDLYITLRPRKLSVTYKDLPYRLDDLTGQLHVQPDRIEVDNITGKHGPATVKISGGQDSSGLWTLAAEATDVALDDDFRAALPPAVARSLAETKLAGRASISIPELRYRAAPTTAPATSEQQAGRLDFKGRLSLADAAFDAGAPFSKVSGTIDLEGSSIGGRLGQVTGAIRFQSFNVFDRPGKDLQCSILKPADRDAVQLAKLETQLAGGQFGGQIEAEWPADRPAGYAMRLALDGADIQQLFADTPKDAQGKVSASLMLQGQFADPATRRGGGDVQVQGKQLYQIPILLGLPHITSLALPITSPYNEATARYDLDGQRVLLRKIELRSGSMLMQGNGQIDYATMKMRMNFTTESAAGWKIPLLEPFLKPARDELLQIQVTGTVQAPKVSASSFQTFTTVIDAVLKGGDTKPNGKKNGE